VRGIIGFASFEIFLRLLSYFATETHENFSIFEVTAGTRNSFPCYSV